MSKNLIFTFACSIVDSDIVNGLVTDVTFAHNPLKHKLKRQKTRNHQI